MRTIRSGCFVLLTGFYSLTSFSVNAESQIELKHAVTNSYSNGTYQSVSITLHLNNLSNQDYHRVKLSPSGSIFSGSEQDNLVSVGYLPAMGQNTVEWTFNTPIAIEYFNSGMPIYFLIKAKYHGNEEIEIPVYSHGGAEL